MVGLHSVACIAVVIVCLVLKYTNAVAETATSGISQNMFTKLTCTNPNAAEPEVETVLSYSREMMTRASTCAMMCLLYDLHCMAFIFMEKEDGGYECLLQQNAINMCQPGQIVYQKVKETKVKKMKRLKEI